VTERLYYEDPYLTEFDAQIISVERLADGRVGAVLDRTAFYPTSGGQPFDTGSLGDARVTEVIDRDDGTIVHVVDKNVAAGSTHGRIDWARRFEHMQQHTGQHVLSAAFDRLHKARTVSFHLGASLSTIDLEPAVTAEQIASAVERANQIIWEDRPVTIRFADAADATAVPLRKESRRKGTLRLIEVDGFDISACGGTHVARTGAIGIVAVPIWERYKGGTRVSFACGIRALRQFEALRDTVSAAMRSLGTSAPEVMSSIERVQNDLKESRRALRGFQTRLAAFEADVLASRAVAAGARRVVVEALDGWDAAGIKEMASAVTARPGHLVVLFTASCPANIVVARAADVDVDAAALLRALTAQFGGKGGGRPDLAQGGGLSGNIDEMVAFVGKTLDQT
jgi:alanyl-tRNA synthetase